MDDQEIVVGYDGSADARVALDWALDEATRSGRPVRLAYVFEWLTVTDWLGPGTTPGTWPDETARREVEQQVRHDAAEAAARRPGLRVQGDVLDGPTALVLSERSARAALLVLGSRGRGGFSGLLVGSTAVTVSAHAACPVVVVREDAERPAPTGAPVVVGFDGSPGSLPALGWAVERAAGLDVPLRVVRAWSPMQYRTQGFEAEEATAVERADTDEALAPWRDRHPQVRVDVEVSAGSPGALLLAAGRGAQVVAVGTRGRGGLRGMLLGSVSQQMINHAPCPVAVIRQPSE
ncbi:universal stress protein [Micromonospora sp. NPDC000207]|uniref:universal stress protein n=1 Tax=Micromonospora sp. NPDC000207 TaxID=3154246 RepID=UPI0033271421